MRTSIAVVLLLTAFDPIFTLKCFSFARHELKLEDIFDYGLVECPKTSIGCFYYPHWQCFEKKCGVAYSITGCLNNPNLCITNKTATKLNDVARCCYYSGCNYALYKYLTALNDSTPVHDFKDCDQSMKCDETPVTSTTTSDQFVTAPTVTYSSQESSTIVTRTSGVISSSTPGSTDTTNTPTATTLTSSSESNLATFRRLKMLRRMRRSMVVEKDDLLHYFKN
ncbi:unnamed protein product [Cylicocyclus nassatus]|uniref:Uncharacterized protein n=1 Tax=Cylicocyclus nassatus TaxID=53992 RepID=A0AA36H7J0_CYLNA|nr:unnamed protein product [Cylicocyclus nassatus]